MRAKMDKANTVQVNGKDIVIPPKMAEELRVRAPHPKHMFAGEYSPAMLRRQELRMEVAKFLDIPVSEVPNIIRQLKQQGN